MSDTILVAFISAGGTLLVSIVTLVANAFIERFKSKSEIQEKEYQFTGGNRITGRKPDHREEIRKKSFHPFQPAHQEETR